MKNVRFKVVSQEAVIPFTGDQREAWKISKHALSEMVWNSKNCVDLSTDYFDSEYEAMMVYREKTRYLRSVCYPGIELNIRKVYLVNQYQDEEGNWKDSAFYTYEIGDMV